VTWSGTSGWPTAETVLGHHLPVVEVVSGPPVEPRRFDLEPRVGGRGLHDRKRRVDDLDPDPVARNHGDLVRIHSEGFVGAGFED
jgi:hypothetical protein